MRSFGSRHVGRRLRWRDQRGAGAFWRRWLPGSGYSLVTQAQYERWQAELSNWGRWGKTTSWARST